MKRLFYASGVSLEYASMLSRWGGEGHEDLLQRAIGKSSSENMTASATSKADPCVLNLLNVLCFSTSILKTTWGLIQSDSRVVSDLYGVIDAQKR